jgi:hypothetical protein
MIHPSIGLKIHLWRKILLNDVGEQAGKILETMA